MALPFAAVGTLAQALLGFGSANKANALQQASVNETRRSNRESEKLAKASRTDAMGNTLRYVDGQGWVTDVAPIVRAIMDGQSREQLATLREDAPRARAASVRKDERSQAADAEFTKLMTERSNRNARTEAEYQAEELIAAATNNRGGVPAQLLTAAIRSGDPKALRDVAAASREASPNVSNRYNAAKKAGTQQYLAEKSAGDQVFFNELGQLNQIASNTDGAQPYMADINGQMASNADDALKTLMQAVQSGGQQLSGALSRAGQSVQTPNIGAIFEGLQGIQDGPKLAQAQAQQEALARALMQADIAQKQAQTQKLRSSF